MASNPSFTNRISAYTGDADSKSAAPHAVEREVRQLLSSLPGLEFPSLVVRRVDRDSVCLTGQMVVSEPGPDICNVACQVPGVRQVINHLMVRNACSQ